MTSHITLSGFSSSIEPTNLPLKKEGVGIIINNYKGGSI